MGTEQLDEDWLAEHPGFTLAFGFAPTLAAWIGFHIFGAVNLFWSSMFGLGGWMLRWLLPMDLGPLELFGLLGWPAILWIALHRLGEAVGRLAPPARRAALCVYGASLCLVAPMHRLADIPDSIGIERVELPLYFLLWVY